MTIFLSILCFFFFATSITLFLLLKRFAKRAVQYDDMFESVVEDMDVFIEYLDGLLSKGMFSNSPDVRSLNGNMRVMRERFDGYVNAFYENSPKEEKKAS